jgi:hypothetical protein
VCVCVCVYVCVRVFLFLILWNTIIVDLDLFPLSPSFFLRPFHQSLTRLGLLLTMGLHIGVVHYARPYNSTTEWVRDASVVLLTLRHASAFCALSLAGPEGSS